MFRQEIRTFCAVFVAALFFTACGTSRVLGLHREEAAEFLKSGDLSFVIDAELPANFPSAVNRLVELSRIHPAAAFYAGLLAGTQSGSSQEQTLRLQKLLFSATLDSPSPPARREAASRLASLVLENPQTQYTMAFHSFLSAASFNSREDVIKLRAASLFRLELYEEVLRLLPPNTDNNWKRALAHFSSWQVIGDAMNEAQRQEIITFLFHLPSGDLRRWAYSQALSAEGLLTPQERGIISSRRFPISHAITLNNLRPALEDGGLLFFSHPSLIGDLARAYQFTPPMRQEGLDLFAAWLNILESGVVPQVIPASGNEDFQALQAFVHTLDNDAVDARRYLLLHHSGRIERSRGRLPASTDFFWRALEIAPDSVQADACLWYIAMNSVMHSPSTAAEVFIRTIPMWTDMFIFNGAIDRLSRYLTSQRRWGTLLEVFHALENSAANGTRPSGSFGQFAFIVGRAVQEGFFTADRSAEAFLRLAKNQHEGTFYYRTMAALSLGENFSPLGGTATHFTHEPAAAGSEHEFILGFFDNGAAAFVMPFIRVRESEFSVPQLRSIAAALAGAGNYPESLRLIARYMRREDFEITREDLYLSHPRPYREVIERYAYAMGLRPEMMFSLIRTESHFAASVASHAGAVGLAQLMPSTALDIAGRIARAGGTDHRTPAGINLIDPGVNVHLGSFYMRHLITNQMGGSVMLALLAYNGGQGRVRRWFAEDRARPDGGLPKDLFLETILYPETRHYGRLVLSAAAIYGYLYYGMTMEEVAENIFQ